MQRLWSDRVLRSSVVSTGAEAPGYGPALPFPNILRERSLVLGHLTIQADLWLLFIRRSWKPEIARLDARTCPY